LNNPPYIERLVSLCFRRLLWVASILKLGKRVKDYLAFVDSLVSSAALKMDRFPRPTAILCDFLVFLWQEKTRFLACKVKIYYVRGFRFRP
jgi:hypothetical protein